MLSSKYRPLTIDEIYPTVDISSLNKLSMELDKDESKIIIFNGPNGTGKTSIARILACMFVGLEGEERKEFILKAKSGSTNQIMEWDFTRSGKAADVELLANLIENACQPGLYQHRHAFILDEVHGAKSDTQKKLIKPLEDNHASPVLIIIITNYIDKLDKGLISRASTPLEFKYMSEKLGIKLLHDIAAKENKPVSVEVAKELYLITSNKAPRDLIGSLQSYFDSGSVPSEIGNADGFISTALKAVENLARSIAKKESQEVLNINSRKLYKAARDLIRTKNGYDAVCAAFGAYYEGILNNHLEYYDNDNWPFYKSLKSVAHALDIIATKPGMYTYLTVDLAKALFLVAEERAKWIEIS